ncbi:alpha/beta fold hydrolase [Phytomonospora endophytica]|uniref:Pimeloyl-ACP methyl ester carboxylesterase n=1 Tax=Phytomonospora endophytica TaxID=714109 RepID=A0A841FMH4_9ACTN|nr:alpha/beta hydrolase [Phytomonospora endophytica]MBB6034998.1 pimeloyl-ACP methyl ester carboxylesterase [Phytomonospora endophytica]GIG71439.1 haloalkane dehalogenase [Phytomonospora endophytica]
MPHSMSRRTLLSAAVAAAGATAVTGVPAHPAFAAEPGPVDVSALPRPRRLRIPTRAGTFDAIAAGPRHGRSVLFLHGFPELAVAWSDYVALFGALGFRAVAVNQRGYSPDVRPNDTRDYRLDHLAEDVVDIAESLGWDGFDLVGHDWGAVVAWVAAARRPDRVRSLSVVSIPHPGAYNKALRTDPAQRRTMAYLDFVREPGIAEQELLADDAAMMREAYAHGVSRENTDTYVRHFSRPGALTPALNWYRANDLFAGHEEKVAVPTLFVWGTKDGSAALSGVEDTANWVSGEYRLVKVEGGRHFLPEERPEIVMPLLRRHLRTH